MTAALRVVYDTLEVRDPTGPPQQRKGNRYLPLKSVAPPTPKTRQETEIWLMQPPPAMHSAVLGCDGRKTRQAASANVVARRTPVILSIYSDFRPGSTKGNWRGVASSCFFGSWLRSRWRMKWIGSRCTCIWSPRPLGSHPRRWSSSELMSTTPRDRLCLWRSYTRRSS
jgi:hypothetical protein